MSKKELWFVCPMCGARFDLWLVICPECYEPGKAMTPVRPDGPLPSAVHDD